MEPKGAWYIESGQGMGATLGIANERRAYTIADRGTWLAFQKRVDLPIFLEKDRLLLNVYSVMEVNPAIPREVTPPAARPLPTSWSPRRCRRRSGPSAWTDMGQALFVPIAGKRDEDL